MNKDQALVLFVESDVAVGGVWRGAWREYRDANDKLGQRREGYLAASWHPYKRVGYFADVKAAKAAVEKDVEARTT